MTLRPHSTPYQADRSASCEAAPAPRRPSSVDEVDPSAGKVSQCRKVRICRKPLCLEPAHLTRRRRAPLRRFAADNPAHSRIVAQALGVVHILVSGKATKYRLPEQPGHCVPTILATACVGQNITRHLGQTEYVVEFAISEQPSIGGHQGATKLEHQAAVEIQPNSIRSRFTPWVRHGRLARSRVRC